MTRSPRRLLMAFGWLAFGGAARAAGGHFDVDDAAIVEPGHCQYETWLIRAPAGSATGLHFGPGCRVGPVEFGLNFERLASSTDSRRLLGPQLKWVADPLVGALSAGVAWSATRDLRHGGRTAQTFYVPATWAAGDRLAFNANLGADWDFAGARTRRVGISAEWAANEHLTVIGERVKFAGDRASRLGIRWLLTDATSVM